MKSIKYELLELLRHEDLIHAGFLPGKIADLEFDSTSYVETILDHSAQTWATLEKTSKSAIDIITAINQLLFDEMGLPGKTDRYKKVIDDADQYYLHKLLTEQSGAPITYALLYQIFAQQLGLKCECFAFPSKFFLRVTEDIDIYVNPFEQGRIMTESEFQHQFKLAMQQTKVMSSNIYQVMDTEGLVAKLVQQLKHVYVLKGEPLKALRCVELLTVIFPESADLKRDRGILYCEMEYFSKAKADLGKYISQKPEAEDAKEIRKLASMLHGYRETMN